jgi:subtilase family serine protease
VKLRTTALFALPLLGACGGTATTSAPTEASTTPPEGETSALPGHLAPWANHKSFQAHADESESIHLRVYLGWRDAAGAEALARAVSDPRSATYGQFLTPAEFRSRFAPLQEDVDAVGAWLKSQGFSLVYVPDNHRYVAVEGTVKQAATTFATRFGMYAVQGKALRAPESAPSVPKRFASIISSIVGIDDSAELVHLNLVHDPDAPATPAYVTVPTATYWGGASATGFPDPYGAGPLPYAPSGYTPAQVRAAYGIGSSYDGTGQTVAIVDAYASPTLQADLDQWSAIRGIPSTTVQQVVSPGTYNVKENNKQDPQGWYGEETLDVEAVHGMAPGAHIIYVGSPNNYQDMDAALNHVVDQALARIVSNSYGFAGEQVANGFIKPLEDTLVQAAAQGIGVYFASGDDSDETDNLAQASADWPATSPWVTAVGGTSLAVGAQNNYLFETGWGTAKGTLQADGTWSSPAWVYGSGGGVSTLFAEPAYQQGVVDAVLQRYGRTGRAVPDVSAIGDPTTGYLIGQTQTFPDGTVRYAEFRIGGTSLACPIFAGIMALADQAKGAPHGFANPALYASPQSAFNDVVTPASTVAAVRKDYTNSVDASGGFTYSLRVLDQTTSLRTTAGYDDVTGRGTPNASFISALSH